MVLKDNTLSGLIYIQQLSIEENNFDGITIDKPGLNRLKKCFNSHYNKVLICGNIFRVHQPGFYFNDKVSDSVLFDVLMDYYKNNKEKINYCGIIVKDCLEEMKYSGRFSSVEDDISMQIPLRNDWNSMDDYYKSFKQKVQAEV